MIKLNQDIIKKELRNGRTLGRALQNIYFSNRKISGCGIDLGARNSNSSYYRYLETKKVKEIKYGDLNPEPEEVIKVDLEKHIPLEDESQDFIILANVLEHIFNYKKCIKECYRILRTGKKLIGVVPFLNRYHPDPEDYHRYTETTLRKVFEMQNFSEINITVLGVGPISSSAHIIGHFFKPNTLKSLILRSLICIDKYLNKIQPQNPAVCYKYYPLGYGFNVTK